MAYNNNFATTIGAAIDSLKASEFGNIQHLIVEKTYAESDLTRVNKVLTGVRNGAILPILNNVPQPDSFPFTDQTNCNISDCDIDNNFSEHKWELGLIECRLGICMRSFDEDFLMFFNEYKRTQAGMQDVDPNSLLIKFILDKFINNLALATWRASFFGDKAETSPYLKDIDGIFAQLDAGSGKKVTITQNGGATYTAQSALTGEEVYDYLTQMYTLASAEAWFDPNNMQFEITRSMGSRLVNYLNTADIKKNNCTCIDPKTASALPFFKTEGLFLFGIPVYIINEWDDIINYLPALNGGGGDNARKKPHRAVLTVKDNILIGTTQREALNSFDVWVSKDDKKIYIEGSSYVGGGVPTSAYVYAS